MDLTFLWIAITAVAVVAIYFIWGRKLGGNKAHANQVHEGRP
jgi:hypothetical protein